MNIIDDFLNLEDLQSLESIIDNYSGQDLKLIAQEKREKILESEIIVEDNIIIEPNISII